MDIKYTTAGRFEDRVWRKIIRKSCDFRNFMLMLGLLAVLPAALGDVTQSIPPVNFSPLADYSQREINYQGVPSIARSPSGRLWAVWYAGPKGEDVNNYLLGSTSEDGGKTWSEIKFLIDPDGDGPLRACNPVFWLDPHGALWLFWCQFPESTTTKSIVWTMVAENPDDENPKWSAPRAIFEGVTQNKPIVNHRGEWLLPVATWYQPESNRVAVSTDNGETWTLRGTATVPNADDRNCDEPILAELADGSLLMLVRTKYGIGKSTSSDAGHTWSLVEDTGLPHTPARIYLGRLQSGNLLLLKHGPLEGKPVGRKHLTAYISKDDGKSWQGGLLLDERGVSYPDADQGADGTIYAIYDHDRHGEREVWFAAMNEEDVLAGKPVSEAFIAPVLVNKALNAPVSRPRESANPPSTPSATPQAMRNDPPQSDNRTRTWTGLGSSSNLRNSENWDDTLTPIASGSSLAFTGHTRLNPNNNDLKDKIILADIIFDEEAGAFTLGGAPFQIEQSILNRSPETQTISADLILQGDVTINAAAGDILIKGRIDGPGRVVKTGQGMVTFEANNTHTGDTTVEKGTLTLIAPSLPDNGSVSISNGAVLELLFDGEDQVIALYLGGEKQANGIYGAKKSGAPNETALISGSGRLKVGP